jgi:hypothetical protein
MAFMKPRGQSADAELRPAGRTSSRGEAGQQVGGLARVGAARASPGWRPSRALGRPSRQNMLGSKIRAHVKNAAQHSVPPRWPAASSHATWPLSAGSTGTHFSQWPTEQAWTPSGPASRQQTITIPAASGPTARRPSSHGGDVEGPSGLLASMPRGSETRRPDRAWMRRDHASRNPAASGYLCRT